MALRDFLRHLRDDGRVPVEGVGRGAAEELAGAAPLLRQCDADARLAYPGTPPALHQAAAEWAAVLLYRGCQFMVCRGVSATVVLETLALPCPAAPTPPVIYSVDLTFRHLPDLGHLAAGLAPGDPLLTALRALGRQWPLSSVGMEELGETSVNTFWSDSCLRQLYVDRVLARGDATRLTEARVRAAARAALGLYPHLCPALRQALAEESPAA